MTEFPTMIRVMEGYEVFGPLQLKRIDWKQEMFMEEEEIEREREEREVRCARIGILWKGMVQARRRGVNNPWMRTTKVRRRQWMQRK